MRDSIACSSGRKTLTSPLDGLSVPTSAITASGQKSVMNANPMPVAIMRKVAAMRSVR